MYCAFFWFHNLCRYTIRYIHIASHWLSSTTGSQFLLIIHKGEIMILEIHKNNDRLELLHSVSRNQKYNILSCEILKDDNVSNIISEHTSNNNYTSIINSINNSDGEIKILTGGNRIDKYFKEIILMLSSLKITNFWNSEFWTKANNKYTPIAYKVKEYLSKILIEI